MTPFLEAVLATITELKCNLAMVAVVSPIQNATRFSVVFFCKKLSIPDGLKNSTPENFKSIF